MPRAPASLGPVIVHRASNQTVDRTRPVSELLQNGSRVGRLAYRPRPEPSARASPPCGIDRCCRDSPSSTISRRFAGRDAFSPQDEIWNAGIPWEPSLRRRIRQAPRKCRRAASRSRSGCPLLGGEPVSQAHELVECATLEVAINEHQVACAHARMSIGARHCNRLLWCRTADQADGEIRRTRQPFGWRIASIAVVFAEHRDPTARGIILSDPTMSCPWLMPVTTISRIRCGRVLAKRPAGAVAICP
jgi:hypothetical protein